MVVNSYCPLPLITTLKARLYDVLVSFHRHQRLFVKTVKMSRSPKDATARNTFPLADNLLGDSYRRFCSEINDRRKEWAESTFWFGSFMPEKLSFGRRGQRVPERAQLITPVDPHGGELISLLTQWAGQADQGRIHGPARNRVGP
ncbi:hypothetical protein RRG08_044609 [Elysia crispata]|uniref:Uncharacterized protein n=1 Tax=Elysia crispata TaxID=231223 RepID=A0AAE0YM06_9GAST|nr:hypothetical protein RRG08_044609 [Elysia crispata]